MPVYPELKKHYHCSMPRVFLSPLAIAVVVLLTGCSNLGTSAKCKDATSAFTEYQLSRDKQTAEEIKDYSEELKAHNELIAECKQNPRAWLVSKAPEKIAFFAQDSCEDWSKLYGPKVNSDLSREFQELSQRVIVNNQECFSAAEVAQAQSALS